MHADLRELPLIGRFDLVTCFDDSLNYLLGGTDLHAAFGSSPPISRRAASRSSTSTRCAPTAPRSRATASGARRRDGCSPGAASRPPTRRRAARPARIDVFVPAGDGSTSACAAITRSGTSRASGSRACSGGRTRAGGRDGVLTTARSCGCRRGCTTEAFCTRRDARKEVLRSDHQEDRQAGPPGPVHHEGVMKVRGSARPDLGWAGRRPRRDVQRPRLKRTREALLTAATATSTPAPTRGLRPRDRATGRRRARAPGRARRPPERFELEQRVRGERVGDALRQLSALGLLDDAADDERVSARERARYDRQLRYFSDVSERRGARRPSTSGGCARRGC